MIFPSVEDKLFDTLIPTSIKTTYVSDTRYVMLGVAHKWYFFCATFELFCMLDLFTGMIRAVEPVLQCILEDRTKTASTHSHFDSCIYMTA